MNGVWRVVLGLMCLVAMPLAAHAQLHIIGNDYPYPVIENPYVADRSSAAPLETKPDLGWGGPTGNLDLSTSPTYLPLPRPGATPLGPASVAPAQANSLPFRSNVRRFPPVPPVPEVDDRGLPDIESYLMGRTYVPATRNPLPTVGFSFRADDPEASPSPSDRPPERPPAAGATPEQSKPQDRKPIGQEPERKVNDLFLTQSSILLPPGDWQYDVGASYAWQDYTLPVVVPPGIVADRRLRRRDVTLPLSVRYGWNERWEWFAALPVGLSLLEVSDVNQASTRSQSGIGDATVGALFQICKPQDDWPETTGTIRLTAPTGDAPFNPRAYDTGLGRGFFSVAAGLNFVKSCDPLVLYGSIGYRHDFERDFMGVSVQPGETIEYSYGVGFAVNDDISLVSEFFGAFQTRYRIDGVYPHSTSLEPMGLRLSLIRRLCPTARVQPFVVFGLNTDAPDVSFGFIYTRDIKNKCTPQPGGGASDAR